MARPESVHDERIHDVLESAEVPVLTAAEVAEELPVGRRTARRRLNALADQGEIFRKDVGGSLVFMSVDVLLYRDYRLDLAENREPGDSIVLDEAPRIP